jgi:hypothetical protein
MSLHAGWWWALKRTAHACSMLPYLVVWRMAGASAAFRTARNGLHLVLVMALPVALCKQFAFLKMLSALPGSSSCQSQRLISPSRDPAVRYYNSV